MAISIAAFVEEALKHEITFDLAISIAIPAMQEIYYPSVHQLSLVYGILKSYWALGEEFTRWIDTQIE